MLVWSKWLRANQYCKIFNEIRLYLKDYHPNQERDWFFPLQCATAAFAEYNFRKEYGLTQIIDGARALQYGSFLEIVSKGHKDPLEEWEKTYHELFPLHSSFMLSLAMGKSRIIIFPQLKNKSPANTYRSIHLNLLLLNVSSKTASYPYDE